MSDLDPTTGRRTATDKRDHFRMATDFFTNHKLGHVPDPIERLAVRGLLGHSIAVCRRAGSDGHIVPEAVLAELGLPAELGKILIADGAWHEADHDCRRCAQPRLGHVYVHDFLEHNRSAAQERRTLERRRASGAENARKRWGTAPPTEPAAAAQPAVERPKRRPGRPRKHPRPELTPAIQQGELIPAHEVGQVLPHPAETRARKRGRPPRTEPRVFEQWVIDAANALADGIARNDPNGVRPNVTETWLNDIRLTHETDKREPEKIMKAIEWSQNHKGSGDFSYADIIKNPKKLRQHFAAMHSRAIKEHQRDLGAGRRSTRPAALAITGMAGALARQMGSAQGRQMGSAQGGMVKGA